MSQQLVFTSAPAGLRPGSRGFTTVAASPDMSPPVMARLELLSGYQPGFPLGDPNAHLNPVCHAYQRVRVGGENLRVLSRLSAAGVDYSGRSNTIAHHVLVGNDELRAGGPAVVLSQPGLFLASWSGPPRHLDQPLKLPEGYPPTKPCHAWERLTGDAGWGGALPAAFLQAPTQPAYVVYAPGTDVLALIRESLALLPPERRWAVTFSTYFSTAPTDVTCLWRCVMAGTPAAQALPKTALVIDLTDDLPAAAEGPLTDAARRGFIHEPTPERQAKPVKAREAVAVASEQSERRRSGYDIADEPELARPTAGATRRGPAVVRAPAKDNRLKLALGAAALLIVGVLAGVAVMFLFRPPPPPPMQTRVTDESPPSTQPIAETPATQPADAAVAMVAELPDTQPAPDGVVEIAPAEAEAVSKPEAVVVIDPGPEPPTPVQAPPPAEIDPVGDTLTPYNVERLGMREKTRQTLPVELWAGEPTALLGIKPTPRGTLFLDEKESSPACVIKPADGDAVHVYPTASIPSGVEPMARIRITQSKNAVFAAFEPLAGADTDALAKMRVFLTDNRGTRFILYPSDAVTRLPHAVASIHQEGDPPKVVFRVAPNLGALRGEVTPEGPWVWSKPERNQETYRADADVATIALSRGERDIWTIDVKAPELSKSLAAYNELLADKNANGEKRSEAREAALAAAEAVREALHDKEIRLCDDTGVARYAVKLKLGEIKFPEASP